MMRTRTIALATALLLAPILRATTVIPPTFEQLVATADVVFEGEVIDTKARFDPRPDGTPIVTDVYFRAHKVLKGTSAPTTILTFIGGEIGDRALHVDGVPHFT